MFFMFGTAGLPKSRKREVRHTCGKILERSKRKKPSEFLGKALFHALRDEKRLASSPKKIIPGRSIAGKLHISLLLGKARINTEKAYGETTVRFFDAVTQRGERRDY